MKITMINIKKNILLTLVSVMLIVICGGCGSSVNTAQSTSVDTSAGTAASTVQTEAAVSTDDEYYGTTLADPTDESREATGEFKVTAIRNTSDIISDGGEYTIVSAGEYTFSGKLENGCIIVNAGDDDKVVINLENVSITSSDNAPISVLNADKVTVNVEAGSYNVLRDERTSASTDENAAIYADCDTEIENSGVLIVESSFDNGIKTKSDLEISDVTLKVSSPGVALKGNDSVTVKSGSLILISTGADGIKTSESDISSKGNQRGTVTIGNAHIDIYASGEGISSAYNTVIAQNGEAPTVNIFTGAYSEYTETPSDSTTAVKSDNEIYVSNGALNISSADDGLHANAGENLDNGETSIGGISISGGTVNITCDDDAIHADGSINILGGNVNISDSHEGLEGNVINISGGTTYVYGSDDGINAAQGTETPLVNISGGYLEVTTPSGDIDAIDSNGNISVTGGFVLVKSGSEMGGMAGSFDADGTLTVTGGTVIALGGISATPANGSCCTYITSGSTLEAGEYTLSDSDGNQIATFKLDGSYSLGWICSENIEVGKSYSLSCGGTGISSWTQSAQTEGSVVAAAGGMRGGMNGAPGSK